MDRIRREHARGLVIRAIGIASANYCDRPICVSVCDADGFLVAFARADGAPMRRIEIAQGKAYPAARMGVSTSGFLVRIHRENIAPTYFCDPPLTALPSGAVIRRDRRPIGAIGISGLTSKEDQAIADLLAEEAAPDRS
jgi:uncharacterized protein GlcG (DUF336 family)